MNTSRKIMFFDIDGTLLASGQEEISPDVMEAIQQARGNGHLMFINTGRTLANLTDSLLNSGFDGFICACGTYILLNGEVIFYNHRTTPECDLVRAKADEYKLDIVFESYHGIYYDPDKLKTKWANHLVTELQSLPKLFAYIPEKDFNYDKFVTWNRPESNLEAFIKDISEYYDYTDRENGFSEFVPAGHSKATGIQVLLDHFNLPLDNAHAVGDSNNDLAMLRYVPHSIAMGNSSPSTLFDEVEYITADIDKGGIRQALEHYGFI